MTAASDPENPLRAGLARRKTPEPSTVVLFGASGDLTKRKLVPALYNLERDGLLPSKLLIVGVARRDKSDADFREEMKEGVKKHSRSLTEGDPLWDEFASRIHYHTGPFEEPEMYAQLGRRLDQLERGLGLPGNRLFYLATSPEHFAPVVKLLDEAGLAHGKNGAWTRVVVEKPFGKDLETARALNRQLLEHLDEKQIYRIDHYLGKETVQNIILFRFANEIFEALWNRKYIDHVQITVAEEIGVEGRGGYYDQAGALRDMVQNHMFQVLSLVAMEPPVKLEADAIRDEKVKVLKAIRRIAPEEVDRHVIRAHYGPGAMLGKKVPGYLEEQGVPRGSVTETYVAMRLEIGSWRWAGVPFLLRSGKRLPKRSSEVYVQFRRPPLDLFGEKAAREAAPNALMINIQPDEGISIRFVAKAPGPDIDVRPVKMDFRYGTSFGVPSPEAYERLLLDAMAGDSTLFTRKDEVEAAWTFITDIHEGWRRSERPPLEYAAGTWGPEEAERLFEGTNGKWRRL